MSIKRYNAPTPAQAWREIYLESPLKLLELSRGECCANPPLLPLLCQNPVVPGVHLVWQPSCGGHIVCQLQNLHVESKEKKKSNWSYVVQINPAYYKIPCFIKSKKKHPSPIPLPLVPEMVRIIGRGGAEEAMRPVCADCERSRFLAPRIFYKILVITFPPSFILRFLRQNKTLTL